MGMATKHIRTRYTTVIFITVFFVVMGCGDGKKTGAEANLTGEALTNNVGGVRTWNCGDSGGNVIATLKDDITLIVSGTGAMASYGYDNCMSCGEPLVPWHNIRDSITNVVIEHGITSIGNNTFKHFIRLTSVIIPISVKDIGDRAFYNCSSMMSITIPNSVTSIGGAAFSFSGLISVAIPDSVTYIHAGAFAGCKNLTSVTIHDRVKSIQELAFNGCTGLTSITIPNSVWGIAWNVFGGCTNLMSIIIQRRSPPAMIDCMGAFDGWDTATEKIYFSNACLYVPASGVAAYRVAEEWKKFKCIKPLESAPVGRK
jgi:hypothetical protein